MDITLTWALPINQLPTDEYDVLYKVWDASGLNNWVLANTTPLPSTTTTYTITGLNPNTIYRVAVTKSCVGGGSYVDEATYINIVCPIISFWQGPVVNSEQTMFYSVNYPDATHVTNTEILVYDTTFDDRFLDDCGAGPTAIPIGRTSYQIADGCTTPNIVSCVKQILDYTVPNTGASGVGYYGLDTMVGFNPFLCDGTTTDPLLFRQGNTYKFQLTTIIDTVALGVTINFSTVDTTCTLAPSAPVYTFTSSPDPDITLLSSAICFDPLTGLVNFTIGDGTGTTNVNDYTFSFSTSDGVSPALPLLDNAGNPITSSNGSYNIYAPIKIQTTAPGGGTALGYTITNAVVSGGSTTYTYTGGINAFTVGQEVFVNSINPDTFAFATTSKTITAATPNSFTVGSFTPAGTYQTGGTASGYAELTDNMTITVDLQPAQNVIILTNQNYSGLTLIQALTQIATAINNAGVYTASAVVIAGLPYLKIDVPDSTYTSASVIFEGPNILTKGGPDIPQISQAGSPAYATSSSVSYNDFLYASYYTSTTAEIIASDVNLVDPPTSYGHDIDIPIWTMALVEQAPPTTVYSLDHIVSGGDYSLNIATNSNTGYIYVADNTTVSVYNGTTFVDSQDLSLLFNGPTTPIRLMEYNTTDNYLYVFTDGSSNNFRIVLNPLVGTWSVGHVGTYAQTNYLKRGNITAWNNITTGPTAAMGTITSAPPEQPILCSTMPCACIAGGPVAPPCPTGVPNWVVGRNDGVRSELFQDSTKNWPVGNSYDTGFFKVYNFDTQQLGFKTYYDAGDPYYNLRGISGDTIAISAAIDSTLTATNVTYSTFASLSGDSYGLFSSYLIVDYNENFTSRSWENTARYLIENGRNGGSNGFIATPVLNPTYVVPDSYGRRLYVNSNRIDKQINFLQGLDDTSEYLLYEIKDGGTCYNTNNNKVFVSLDGGVVQVIPSSGSPIITIQLYKDFPGTTTQVDGSLQMVADPNSNLVYGIARDARSDVDDMNIYVFNQTAQVGVIAGSGLWDENICGQISMDSDFLYFTGKYTRNFYQYNVVTEAWNVEIVPSVYEKFDGYEYGPASPLSRLQGGIERIQGATHIGGGKFVVMNYLQQTFSTELKYVYDVANLFVYDYATNTVDQALVGTGVSSYSGAATSYNLNYHGEFFGINDYNTDYCYGGLGIKVDSNGRIFWKKAVSDQIYMSESHTESGVAQIWGTGAAGDCPASKLIRIWNIQSNGSLVQSKRTILDAYSQFSYIAYDSFNERVITIPITQSNVSAQFYVINPNNLVGSYGVNDNGITGKYNVASNIGGLAVSTYLSGKQTTVYDVSIDNVLNTITYSVRPNAINAGYNGIFPHHYAVGEVVKISGIVSSPVDELNFPNSNTSSTTYATILSVTPTTFTIANDYNATATYTSGGTVIDAVWASIYTASNFGSMAIDNKGSIILTGTGAGNGITGYNNAGTTFVLKYESDDLFTQRENPKVYTTGITSSPCVATPDQLFRGLGTPSVGRGHGQLSNAFLLHVPTQNTYWVMGSKNPSCTISGITGVTYNPIAQTIRYDIPNSFAVGKVISISGIIPSTFNLTRVPIIAADPTGFEISYTGASPGTYVSDGSVSLSGNYVIKVLDDATLATIATIDLSFINGLLDIWGNPDSFGGRFQYSEDTDEIYLYSNNPTEPVYVFSTITNSLVRSSSFNRMTNPYNKLSTVFTLENAYGVPYFSAYALTDTPTRLWFRLDLGNRTYQDDTHDYLNITSSDGLTSATDTYDLYSFSNLSDTFGQWKVNTDTTWASIPGGSNITVNANEIIEFTMFSTSNTLLSVENTTTSTIYDVPSYTNLATFPTYNTLNSMLAFVIKADSVNLSNGDVLLFTFDNPQNPSCPFINSVTINF